MALDNSRSWSYPQRTSITINVSRYLLGNNSFIIPPRLYPNGVYVDSDLVEAAYISKDMSELGSNSQIIAFDHNRVSWFLDRVDAVRLIHFVIGPTLSVRMFWATYRYLYDRTINPRPRLYAIFLAYISIHMLVVDIRLLGGCAVAYCILKIEGSRLTLFLTSLQPQISIRKADGALVATSIPPFPVMLYSLVQKKKWDEVVRLCHFVQSKQLWACAACMAIESKFPLLSI